MVNEAKEYLRRSKDPHATALNMIQSQVNIASCWVADTGKIKYIQELFEVLEEVEAEKGIYR